MAVSFSDLQLAFEFVSSGRGYPKLRDAVIAHPTMAEGFGPLLSNVAAQCAQ
jgi:hypothetical protein